MKTAGIFLVLAMLVLDLGAGAPERLAACRREIDSVDQQLVELIQKRARIVQEVGRIKSEAHLAVTDSSREQKVIAKAEELAQAGPLPAEAVGRIFQKLVEEMRDWEANLAPSVTPKPSNRSTPTSGSK